MHRNWASGLPDCKSGKAAERQGQLLEFRDRL